MNRAADAPAVELVTIGDELLLGDTVDGNSAWLGATLAAAGIQVRRRATVGDDRDAIGAAVSQALDRVPVVICTGGLGPTRDDLTREAIARLTRRPLEPDEGVLAAIRERFARIGRPMVELNRVQALVPRGARVLANARGTAPGLVVPAGSDSEVILLPGVPSEMRPMVTEQVLPLLAARFPHAAPARIRFLRTTGAPESTLAERVDDLVDAAADAGVTVAFLPSLHGVDVRLTHWGGDVAAIERHAAAFAERVGQWLYARERRPIEDVLADALQSRGLTLGLAESCTGGLIARRVTDRPGASAYFAGAIVAYSNQAKTALLGVRATTLEAHGAVSGETAAEMAAGARAALGVDAALSVTGIAGPEGGSGEKPVGTVWIGVDIGAGAQARHFRFTGTRDEIRERAAQAALALLLRTLAGA